MLTEFVTTVSPVLKTELQLEHFLRSYDTNVVENHMCFPTVDSNLH